MASGWKRPWHPGQTSKLSSPAIKATDYPEARKQALKPVGEWNSIEIISRAGAVTALLNGAKVGECEPGQLKEGPIGFQSEGAEIHFRNLWIRDLP